MRITYKLNDACQVTQDVPNAVVAFEFISYMDSLFGVKQCGNCESPNVSPSHAQRKGYDFYSIVCGDCRHELKFGQRREDGRLFPKEWEPPYQGESTSQRTDDYQQSAQQAEPVGASYDDEIPF